MIDLQKQANMLGFRGVYLLKPEPYVHFQIRRKDGTLHENSRHVSDDPTRDYPWANAVLVLLYPYQPYPKTVSISGYYPASNRSYHAAGILINGLRDRGIRAERAALPVRETLLRHGIGIACKNGLTAVKPFGTRFIAQILVLSVPSEMLLHRIDTQVETYKSCSENCDCCASACPTGAISKDGMCFTDCIRADMDGKEISDQTMQQIDCLLGCEHCQFACPLNAQIPTDSVVPSAFSLERILSGDVKEAYELIGKNLRSSGRLEQQAMILAANQGRVDLLPMIYPWKDDNRMQIRQAADYAISLLHKPMESVTI